MQEPGLDFWVTQTGPVLDFHATKAMAGSRFQQRVGQVVRLSFEGARQSSFRSATQLPGTYNYFVGNDQAHWATGVRRFSEVRAEQTYEGVQVVYSADSGAPRYDLVVGPGADLSQVSLRVDGAERVQVLGNGNLRIQTRLGAIEEGGMAAYQGEGSGRVQIPCRLRVSGSSVRFDLGSYDPTKPLIIDPILYSTFLGNETLSLTVNEIALDKSNNPVVVGAVDSGTYPTTTGAYETKAPAPQSTYVTKLNTALSALSFSTFFGSTISTTAHGIALDSSGDPVIVGETYGVNLPVTATAFQKTNNTKVASFTAFATKFNSTGTALIFSTYLGGSGRQTQSQGDSAAEVRLDASGNPVVVGSTASSDFPTTKGAFQTTLKTLFEGNNAFVAKLNSTGSALIFSTYLGGSGGFDTRNNTWIGDDAYSVVLDAAAEPIVVGSAWSSDFPISASAYQKTNLEYPNTYTGFVTKLNATGTGLVFSTYLGGTGTEVSAANEFITKSYWAGEQVNGVALSASQQPIVVGYTASTNFPTTAGAFQTSNSAGAVAGTSGFLTELNSAGTGLVFSTYLGGSYAGAADVVALDSSANILVGGVTYSNDYPVTAGAFQSKLNGTNNGFISRFSSSGALQYSSYIGGTNEDAVTALAVSSLGYAMLGGKTSSPNFPTTYGSYQTIFEPITYRAGNLQIGFLSLFDFTSTALSLTNFETIPSVAYSGEGVNGTVFLSNSATTNTVVSLSATTGATVPATVTVPAGAMKAAFPIFPKATNTSLSVTLTATYGTKSIKQTLPISPPVIEEFTVPTYTLVGGNSITATLVAHGIAASPGTPIALKATTGVTVPPTITLPTGKDSITVLIKTTAVKTSTTGTITATIGTSIATITLNIES
jgi:hypothetical protein